MSAYVGIQLKRREADGRQYPLVPCCSQPVHLLVGPGSRSSLETWCVAVMLGRVSHFL